MRRRTSTIIFLAGILALGIAEESLYESRMRRDIASARQLSPGLGAAIFLPFVLALGLRSLIGRIPSLIGNAGGVASGGPGLFPSIIENILNRPAATAAASGRRRRSVLSDLPPKWVEMMDDVVEKLAESLLKYEERT